MTAFPACDTPPISLSFAVVGDDPQWADARSTGGHGKWAYTPDAEFAGTDHVTYTVSDGIASATATIQIRVALPTEPIARDDTFGTRQKVATIISEVMSRFVWDLRAQAQ